MAPRQLSTDQQRPRGTWGYDMEEGERRKKKWEMGEKKVLSSLLCYNSGGKASDL